MVSSLNPTGVTYTISLNNNSTESAKLTKALAKNQNPNISVVSAINGRQLSSSAKIGTKIVENMGTARALFANALAATGDLIAQLEEMKGELQDLNDANPQILAIGQTNYVSEVARINDILATANFNGKNLFDGTLAAKVAAADVPEEMLPANYSPYRNQIDFISFLMTAIAKLTPGNGTQADAPVAGRFQPLFPVINDYYGPEDTYASNVKTAINFPAVITIADIRNATAATGGSDIGTFTQAINDAINSQKLVGNADNAGAMALTKGQIDTVADAAAACIIAALGQFGTSPPLTAAQITQASTDIKAVYNNAAAATSGIVRTNARDLNVSTLYPVGANSLVISVYDSIATAVRQTGNAMFKGNGVDNANAGAALKAADNASIDSMMATTRSITFDAGNVETAGGRATATTLINSAITILNGIQAQIIGQQGNLEKAKDSMNVQVTELSAAASNLLSADYEKIVPKLTQLLREAKVLSLAFGLQERQISTVIAALESAAAAA